MFPSCWALTEDAQQRNRQTANTFTNTLVPILACLNDNATVNTNTTLRSGRDEAIPLPPGAAKSEITRSLAGRKNPFNAPTTDIASGFFCLCVLIVILQSLSGKWNVRRRIEVGESVLLNLLNMKP